ncbi:MAG TPA: EthD family reductase [Stellaceae bacterium]|nr:EthD family reductase [Stellaceae bacterium]
MSASELARLGEVAATLRGVRKALALTPTSANDPYLDDGAPPLLTVQFYFADVVALEVALAENDVLSALGSVATFPNLVGADTTQQAMLARVFAVAERRFRPIPNCTYLVAYEGVAEDPPAWLAYYLAHHPSIMARLPGIRELEVYTRLDWCSALPARRVAYLQRNKVVFDNETALRDALNSPVRHELRADFRNFPRFSGPVTHYPMETHILKH